LLKYIIVHSAILDAKLIAESSRLLNFKKVIEEDPENLKSHFALASIYDRLGNEKGVIEELETICNLSPDKKIICYNLASLYQMNGDYNHAIETLLKILDVDPADFNAYVNLGILYLRTGQPKQALSHFGQAQNLDDGRKELLFYIGLSHEALGAYDKAIESYENALTFF